VIEVNLVPGAARRGKRRSSRVKLALPTMGKLPQVDRFLGFVVAAWVRRAHLTEQLDGLVQDSVHYATVIKANERLRARRDSIAQKLNIIQEVDAGRYVWAHVLDEVSRALPEYTWITKLTTLGAEKPRGGAVRNTSAGGSEGEEPAAPAGPKAPSFRIEGFTGNNLALTEFMQELEASPFIRMVRLTSTEGVEQSGRFVHSFMLEAYYEEAPAEVLETVPLFKAEEE
jgi:Tfp pilus assembly protein PilN